MKKVLVILGPTASGKSDLGVRLAKKFKGEIISADSRQVYKSLNIGSGKITRKEMRGVKHHLLDVADPKKQFTVVEFVKEANKALTMIYHSAHLPMIVGGTGFYIDALAGKIPLPDVPPDRKLRARLAKRSNTYLFNLLRRKDPKRAKSIDPMNKVRLIRALEIVAALGHVPKNKSYKPPAYSFIYIGLLPKNLDARIRERLKKRLPAMIAEGRRLRARGLSYKRMHELGLEYRHIALFLQGKVSKEEMAEKLYYAIRQFSRRQMTWFKRNKKIKWFTLSRAKGFKPEEYRKIEKYIHKKLLAGDEGIEPSLAVLETAVLPLN